QLFSVAEITSASSGNPVKGDIAVRSGKLAFPQSDLTPGCPTQEELPVAINKPGKQDVGHCFRSGTALSLPLLSEGKSLASKSALTPSMSHSRSWQSANTPSTANGSCLR